YSNRYNPEQPVIAIACRGNSCGNVSLTPPFSYVTANAICAESVRHDILPLYLYYYLKQADFSRCISGAAQSQITQKALGELPVPVCSLQQQKLIVKRLQTADNIIRLRQEQLQAIHTLKHSFYTECFTTYPREHTCPYCTLADIATIQCGKQNAGIASGVGPYPFFSCAKTPKRVNHYHFDCECVMLTGNIDFQVHYFNGKFDAYQRTYIIESAHADFSVPYLYAFLEHYIPTLQQQALGGIIKYIRRTMLNNIRVPLLPTPMRQQLGAFALNISRAEQNATQSLCKIQQLHRQMLWQFFS
ncbi:MAG: restriction endonuclease subunit S, partial [Akkermansia sp.]|nr:restriction endonuclease subunit S [Akkermansia sp.]